MEALIIFIVIREITMLVIIIFLADKDFKKDKHINKLEEQNRLLYKQLKSKANHSLVRD